ncbi:NEK protein kinase [Saprolegnia parasitica CBS 223.65]|uniref:non-specific serine/threonine protein kinase n=1 Tax=Saprolegnia parasitica (strain CBS 223.65) TaxID=695850 RepID=A0A067CSM2_SAPPC|nr:NEK protein kinase [Saprolegnia parasitica CBS 223.65]KDO29792.1 NEK protein kinase [Saprolegnia parasitica CBS 223.65]|eukprot:XP_012199436.1 NEK protein kinase [Saprolegnia parasitica CBS 223.65]
MDPRFETVRTLGRGSHGDAVLVRHRVSGALVVAKTIHAPLAACHAEVDVMRRLQHPNIVSLIESTTTSDTGDPVLFLEYADGGDLHTFLLQHSATAARLPEAHIVRILIQLSLALQYLHERNIVHRSLRINIFLTASGVVKLGDFGVAKALSHTLDLAATQVGTPLYLCPEICDGNEYNTTSDLWGLGCVLHELLTFAPPFQGRSWPVIVQKIVTAMPSPSIDGHYYSPDIIALASQLLSKTPHERPSATDILARPFIQRHIMHLVSAATWDALPKLQADPPPRRPTSLAAVLDGMPILCEKRATSPKRRALPDTLDDAARRQFHENQRAARAYKERMDELQKGPAVVFDDVSETSPEPAAAPRDSAYKSLDNLVLLLMLRTP